jgi:hypothetical protein
MLIYLHAKLTDKRDSRRSKDDLEGSISQEAEVSFDGYRDIARENTRDAAKRPINRSEKGASKKPEDVEFARELLNSWRKQYACLLEALASKNPREFQTLEVVRANLHVRSGIPALDDLVSLSLWALTNADVNVALIATEVVLDPILDAWLSNANDTCSPLVQEGREAATGSSSAYVRKHSGEDAWMRGRCMKKTESKTQKKKRNNEDIDEADVEALSLLLANPCLRSQDSLGIAGALFSRVNALTLGLHHGLLSDDVKAHIPSLLDLMLDVALPAAPPLASHQAVSEAYAMRVGFRGDVVSNDDSDESAEISIRDLQNAEFYWRSSSAIRLLGGVGNIREVDRSGLDLILLHKSKLLFVKQLHSEAVKGLVELYQNSPSSPLVDADLVRNIGNKAIIYISTLELVILLLHINVIT